MGIVKGLKGLNQVMDKPQSSGGDGTKARWVKLEDAESVKVRFLGFIAVEHTNPKDYRRKALCTMEDQGKCYGCEQHRKDYKAGWKGRSRLYINVLIDDGKEDPYVGILSQGSSGKTITPTLIEYAGEMGSITNLMWRIKRTGTKTDTSYTIIPLAKDETPFDGSSLELYQLEDTAVRDMPYTEQEAFFAGENNNGEESTSSSSVDW